jgi:hypothetical protein
MSLTQFKDPHIYSYKFIDHWSKINILSRQANTFNIS